MRTVTSRRVPVASQTVVDCRKCFRTCRAPLPRRLLCLNAAPNEVCLLQCLGDARIVRPKHNQHIESHLLRTFASANVLRWQNMLRLALCGYCCLQKQQDPQQQSASSTGQPEAAVNQIKVTREWTSLGSRVIETNQKFTGPEDKEDFWEGAKFEVNQGSNVQHCISTHSLAVAHQHHCLLLQRSSAR